MKIWELVKELEEKSGDAEAKLGEIKATLLVNYGEEGRAIKGLISQSNTPLQMLIIPLQKLQAELDELKGRRINKDCFGWLRGWLEAYDRDNKTELANKIMDWILRQPMSC